MAVYVSETTDDDLRIIFEGEEVRRPLSGRTVVVTATTPAWYRRIADTRGYRLTTESEQVRPSEVALD